MKKIDLLYKNLLDLLTDLTLDGPQFSIFYGSLGDSERNELVSISERIGAEKIEISKSYVRKEFHSSFIDLIGLLDMFKSKYPDYPGFRKNEIYAIISLVQKLTAEYEGSEIDLEEEIDLEVFSVLELSDYISQDNFLYYDNVILENSVFLFNINKKEEFKNFTDATTIGTILLFHLLGKIGIRDNPLSEKKYVLVKEEFGTKPKMVWATLCLHIIKVGKIVHEPHEYHLPPNITSSCKIQLGQVYQQFTDSIDILSEYNYQKDILDKYLRIYHVIENFMYKRPLVDLEKDANGNVFSIRDFKRMYDAINDSEPNTLKKLIVKVLDQDYNSTTKFSGKILADWMSLVPSFFPDDLNLNRLLKTLNISNSRGIYLEYSLIDLSSLGGFITQLIYSFRNSMVHNRETEFHLTHYSLNNHAVFGNTARIVLEKFLIPLMEEICFYLIIEKNDIVWYDNSSLKLWEEN